MTTQFTPIADRVLVRRIDAESVTKGGIHIPEQAKERPTEGEVIAVGRGKLLDSGKLVEPCVRVGDRILFNKYGGTEIKLDDVEHVILREDDILGTVAKTK